MNGAQDSHLSGRIFSGLRIGRWICELQIGVGSFSTVWKARAVDSDAQAAIKIIPITKMNGKLQKCLRREISTLLSIRHPHVVRLYDVEEFKDIICLITEYCCNGELSRWENRSSRDNVKIMQQLMTGLHYLHDQGFIHRDLKPQNVLFDSCHDVKIADFGFACQLQDQHLAETLCGSPLYMAPEILLQRPYDVSVDIWSLGILSYELFTGHPPFCGVNCYDLLMRIRKDWKLLTFPSDKFPPAVIDLVSCMLHPIPSQRIFSSNLYYQLKLIDLETLEIANMPKSICSVSDNLQFDLEPESHSCGEMRNPSSEMSYHSCNSFLRNEAESMTTGEAVNDFHKNDDDFVLIDFAHEMRMKNKSISDWLHWSSSPSSASIAKSVCSNLSVSPRILTNLTICSRKLSHVFSRSNHHSSPQR